MLERAALQPLGVLGGSAPLLVSRARVCLVAWVGWHGEGDLAAIESAHVDVHAFLAVLAAWGSRG